MIKKMEEVKKIEDFVLFTKQVIPEMKEKYDRVILKALLNFLEKSEYGQQSAEIKISFSSLPVEHFHDESDTFAQDVKEVLDFNKIIFGNLGNVSITVSEVDARSVIFKFKVGE